MRGQRFGQALILISFAVGAAAARAQDAAGDTGSEHYQVRTELGTEFDSNAHRVEQLSSSDGGLMRSFLQRLVVSGQFADQVAPRHAIAVSATAAAKIFDAPAARSESVAIAQSALVWRAALGPRTWLSPSGAYYEAFQSWGPAFDPAGERRDFRSMAPVVDLRTGLRENVELGMAVGYRWLVFKPDRNFDFDGPTAGVNVRWLYDTEGGADWEARAGAALEYRRFGGPAQVGNCPPDGLPCPGPEMRTDNFVMGQAEVTRRPREWSFITLDYPTCEFRRAALTLWDVVIEPLVTLGPGSNNIYGWLELVFRFCANKPFVYYSKYTPSPRIFKIARAHNVVLHWCPLKTLSAPLRERHGTWRQLWMTPSQWRALRKRLAADPFYIPSASSGESAI